MIHMVVLALMVLSMGVANADELEDYLAHVREVRMTAMAEMQVRTMVSLLAGYSTLEYQHDEASGQYWPTFTSQTCGSPDADPELVAREQEARSARVSDLVLQLHALADLDGSGFVTDREGGAFRHQVECGFLAAQLAEEGPLTLERMAGALGVSEVEALDRLGSYAMMYPVLVDLELAPALPGFGAPPVQQLQD